jgi:hypothetical protein
MSLLRSLLPGALARRYIDIKRRLDRLETSLRYLEMAMDGLVVTPRYSPGPDVGFNGQAERKRIFGELVSAVGFDDIIETGTWLGNTTAYMRQTADRPVHSCELNPRFHAIAKLRLQGIEQVFLKPGDSRRFLRELSAGEIATRSVFVYLDAHWYDDLPLNEELEIIGGTWRRQVTMVDDFKVPHDPGYGFDEYGGGKVLDLDLIAATIRKHRMAVYFPARPATGETGARRGCVLLAPEGELADTLDGLTTLRRWRGPLAGDLDRS